MKTLLVLAPHPELAEQVRASLDAATYRVIHRVSYEEAEPLLHHALASVCCVDAELPRQSDSAASPGSVQTLWLIEKIRRTAPGCPVFVFTGPGAWQWEEEAYLHGVTQVVSKPVRARMLNALIERALATSTSDVPATPTVVAPPPALPPPPEVRSTASQSSFHTLEILRDFSSILTHSLNAEAMLKQFLLMLREIIGVNRAAIFLRQTTAAFGATVSEDGRRLHSACAIGLSPGLLQHFDLSFDSGLAAHLFRLGRILRRDSAEARADVETQKEFELLGAQVAIPILDRETLIGVAVFDGRLTGEMLSNGELELIFHLLEQLGLAVKNIWLHDQVAANHEMMAGILRELSSACVVVSHDLTILHANKMARKYFGQTGRRGGDLEFSDLPSVLGSKVYQVLKTGSGLANFKYETDQPQKAVFNITITPFQRQNAALPGSVLLIADDLSQGEQLRRLEVETANLRLIRTMADRLAHEIGNALVPLSTHQQLLAERFKDPEFRASLDLAMAENVKRISRLTSQMRFLARDSVVSQEAFPLAPLLDDAFQEAQRLHPAKSARMKYEDEAKTIMVTGDRAALRHALAEVMLNALQANPGEPRIGVRLHTGMNGNSRTGLEIEIEDNGAGFSPEAASKVPSPFYTTRTVGLGLGLAVTRKIIETHNGKLEIVTPKTGRAGIVRISLPIAATGNAGAG